MSSDPPVRLAPVFGQRAAGPLGAVSRPRWSPDGRCFWYALRRPEGVSHQLVDVTTRSQRELYTAERLWAALHDAGTEATAESLADVVWHPAEEALDFTAAGRRWRWLADAALHALGEAFGAHEVPAPDGSVAVSLDATGNLRLRRFGEQQATALTEDAESDHGWGDFADFISQVSRRLAPQPMQPRVLWAPDSCAFAVLRVDRRALPLRHLVQSRSAAGPGPVTHAYRYPTPPDAARAPVELWFVRPDGGRQRAAIDGLECGGLSHFDMGWGRWDADGRHFHLVDADRARTRLTLWRVDSHDGRARVLLQEQGARMVLPSPSLAEPAVFHVLRDASVIWWSQRSGWGHLWHVLPDGSSHALTQGDWQVRSLLHVDEDTGQVLFSAGGREPGMDPYLVQAYRVPLAGGEPMRLTPDVLQHELLPLHPQPDAARSVSLDGRCFVDMGSSIDTAPRAVLRDADGQHLFSLWSTPAQEGWPAELPLAEAVSVTLDGVTLWGALYKPVGFDTAGTYPVVELIYGAPQTAVVPKSWSGSHFSTVAEHLAALGFVVFCLDGPGTPYRSHAFQCASHGRLESCGGLPQHVAALRALGAERPWMDLQRVGIVGASGGGYAVVHAMAAFPDVYRVGVSMCGNHDQADYVAGWGDCYQGLYSEAAYATQASQAVAGRITGQLLLMHGEMDDNVHPVHTLRVADALIQAGRDFEMHIVPGAGHMLILLPWVQQRIWQFLQRHLSRRDEE
jgi:dipeptidyl aminopeptidase/acylaminoacyl peptidase